MDFLEAHFQGLNIHSLHFSYNISHEIHYEYSFNRQILFHKLCVTHNYDKIYLYSDQHISGGPHLWQLNYSPCMKQLTIQFDVILHTNSFYDKEVTWIHTVEQGEFSHLLHGDELIFNSGLNFTSQDWLKEFLKSLKDAHASGLIISVKSRPAFSQEIIDYCNEIQLPLFSTSWDTSVH